MVVEVAVSSRLEDGRIWAVLWPRKALEPDFLTRMLEVELGKRTATQRAYTIITNFVSKKTLHPEDQSNTDNLAGGPQTKGSRAGEMQIHITRAFLSLSAGGLLFIRSLEMSPGGGASKDTKAHIELSSYRLQMGRVLLNPSNNHCYPVTSAHSSSSQLESSAPNSLAAGSTSPGMSHCSTSLIKVCNSSSLSSALHQVSGILPNGFPPAIIHSQTQMAYFLGQSKSVHIRARSLSLANLSLRVGEKWDIRATCMM